MSDIQKARDVLTKWRDAVEKEAFEALLDADQDSETGFWDYAKPETGVHLIFGTAGNPALLDAIDAFLSTNVGITCTDVTAEWLAQAIIESDERMSA